jgi:hypothetical protein
MLFSRAAKFCGIATQSTVFCSATQRKSFGITTTKALYFVQGNFLELRTKALQFSQLSSDFFLIANKCTVFCLATQRKFWNLPTKTTAQINCIEKFRNNNRSNSNLFCCAAKFLELGTSTVFGPAAQPRRGQFGMYQRSNTNYQPRSDKFWNCDQKHGILFSREINFLKLRPIASTAQRNLLELPTKKALHFV